MVDVLVVSSAVDKNIVVANGNDDALKKIDVYHEGINTKLSADVGH